MTRGDAVRLRHVPDAAPGPDPVIHPDTEAYWSGLERGELRVQVCAACGTYRYPFSPVCYRCLSFQHSWEPISPEGRIAAAVVVRRATGDPIWGAAVPYLSGLVDLEHDLRLPGRILCVCGAATRRGTAVRAVVLASAGHPAMCAFAHSCVEATASDDATR